MAAEQMDNNDLLFAKTVIKLSAIAAILLVGVVALTANCQKNLDDNQADAYRVCIEAGYTGDEGCTR